MYEFAGPLDDSHVKVTAVPRYFLFGEPAHDADERFFHIETIAERSKLHDWKIRAHAHRDLHQLLVLLDGGADIRFETPVAAARAPALLLVPAGTVHAFQFERDTLGYVITMAITHLEDLARREPAFRLLFEAPLCVPLSRAAANELELEDALVHLHREFLWTARARIAAAEARLITVLVAALRAMDERGSASGELRGPRAALVARFRHAVENNFRAGWSVDRYAKALGVTPAKLRSACLEITAKAPTRLLHDRLILEAKRNLLYTHMTIAEAAYDLGFSDPAYFSRFFSERVGESPAAFRRRR